MSLNVQFYTMLSMIGMGCWIGIALDTYGRFLKRPSRAKWLVIINDLTFWFVQALIIFYTLLLVNEGELRIYVFLALLCGYAAYQSLLHSTYLRFLEVLIQIVLSVYNFTAKLITVLIIRPIRYIIQVLLLFLVSIWNFILLVINFILKVFFTIIRWICLFIWRMIPKKVKKTMRKIAGFRKDIENLSVLVQNWWKKFRG